MPTARRLVASRCPECSAPVDLNQIETHIQQVRCAYCGTHLLLPKRTPPAAEPVRYRPPVLPPPGRALALEKVLEKPKPPPRTGNAGCGFVVALLIFGVMLLTDVNLVYTLQEVLAEGRNAPRELWTRLGASLPDTFTVGHLYGPPIPLVAHADAPPLGQMGAAPLEGVLIQSRVSGASALGGQTGYGEGELLYFDPQTQALRWRAPGFSRNFNEIVMTAGPRLVYVADQGRLTALDRETGHQAWQLSLANPIAQSCHDCLQYMAGYVVALTRDGTLQAYAADNGLPAWSRRLHAVSTRLYNVGGQPAVVDAGTDNRAVFYLFDRITGTELHTLRPECENAGRANSPTHGTPFVVTADGLRLYVLGSGSGACVWRYNLVTGALEWLYNDNRDNQVLPFSWSSGSHFTRNGVLYATQRDGRAGVLRAVDSATNTVVELARADQFELALELAVNDTLVVRATPTYARHEPELWGLDAQTGVRRWQVQLDMHHAFDTLLLRAVPPQASGEPPSRLFVGQCLWEDDVCLWETLDARTGVSQGQTRQPVSGSVTGVRYAHDAVWLNIWGKLHAIDLTTAQPILTWPR